MYKALIFDFDFTLGDSAKGIAASINYALVRLGYAEKEMEEIRKTIGLSLKRTYAVLTCDEDEGKAQLFTEYFREKADEVMVADTQLYQPVREVFAGLREKGCKIGIVTTKYHYRIEQILDKFDMRSAVDIIIGAEDVKIEKPDPEGLLLAAGHLNAAKEQVLYIGDSLVDAEAAQRAGIDFAGVLTGTTTADEFAKFGHVCIAEDLYGIYQFACR